MNSIYRGRRVGEIDWGSFLNTVVDATGKTIQSANQTKALQAQANAQLAAAQLAAQNSWGLTANTAGQQSALSRYMPIILIGGVAVAAFLILRKKRR